MAKSTRIDLSVLLTQEGDFWVAQCLEYDIAAQGKDLREVKFRFAQTVVSQIAINVRFEQSPLEDISQAPEQYWNKFHDASVLGREPIRVPEFVPPAYQIKGISSEMRVL